MTKEHGQTPILSGSKQGNHKVVVFYISIMKYLTQATYEVERFILAHSFRDSSTRWIGGWLLVWPLLKGAHHGRTHSYFLQICLCCDVCVCVCGKYLLVWDDFFHILTL
jgi:hypothetical protein